MLVGRRQEITLVSKEIFPSNSLEGRTLCPGHLHLYCRVGGREEQLRKGEEAGKDYCE